MFETAERVIVVHVSVHAEIAGFLVVIRGWVVVVLPVVPIGVAELALSSERTRAFALPLREDVLGVLAEVVHGVVEHRAGRVDLERLEAGVLVNDCQLDGLVLAELRLAVLGSHVDGLVLAGRWCIQE